MTFTATEQADMARDHLRMTLTRCRDAITATLAAIGDITDWAPPGFALADLPGILDACTPPDPYPEVTAEAAFFGEGM